ncbi:MAG TPA: YciI family protein [Bryobacteraceae bacterium]|nr:YciI family protein [Bryobacteraceae bacterium]
MMNVLIAWTALFFAQATPAADSTDVYYLIFLKSDPARKALSKEEGERIMAAHMANIHSMADRGVLVAAGPFDDKPAMISGIFFLRASSFVEARRIAMQDPTVVEHRNQVDEHAWRGPKEIGAEYFRLHKDKPDTPEGMGVQPLFLIYRGARWADREQLWSAHIDYLAGLQRDGKLAMQGPTDGEDELSAMVVFNRISDEEAQRLMSKDPAVKANVLRTEFHRWWCAEHVIPK